MQQLLTLSLRATTKTVSDRQALQQQRLRLQHAKNTMTSKAITTFNRLQLKQLVYTASPLTPFFKSPHDLLQPTVTYAIYGKKSFLSKESDTKIL